MSNVTNETMANSSIIIFGSNEKNEEKEEKRNSEVVGYDSEENVDGSIWAEKATTSSSASLKSEFRKLFFQFLTQLAWGCIINLRVG